MSEKSELGGEHHLAAVRLADLPVPAGIEQLEALLAEIAGVGEIGRCLLRARRADQRLEIDAEPLVEGALDGLAIERGEDQPATTSATRSTARPRR